MGADAAGVNGWSRTARADLKVFVNGPFVMGFTSSFRMGQLLRWTFVPPVRRVDIDDEQYMSTAFVDAVRGCLKAGGLAKKEHEVESGGTFLVGYNGRIWEVADDYQVGRVLAGFNAIGSGFELCLGALHVTADLEPEVRLRLALDAATRFSGAVCAPFTVLREP